MQLEKGGGVLVGEVQGLKKGIMETVMKIIQHTNACIASKRSLPKAKEYSTNSARIWENHTRKVNSWVLSARRMCEGGEKVGEDVFCLEKSGKAWADCTITVRRTSWGG